MWLRLILIGTPKEGNKEIGRAVEKGLGKSNRTDKVPNRGGTRRGSITTGRVATIDRKMTI